MLVLGAFQLRLILTGFAPALHVVSRDYVRYYHGGNFDGGGKTRALAEVSLTSQARKNG